MSLNSMRWSAAATWIALTVSVFLVFDAFDGTAVPAWLLAAVIALLPPIVVMVLSGQEQARSAATALHVVDRPSS